MALVSDDPGGQSGAMGIITLEDVIEELIGEVEKLLEHQGLGNMHTNYIAVGNH